MPGATVQITSIPFVPGGLKSRQFHPAALAGSFTAGMAPLIVVNVRMWYPAKPGARAKA